jgi:RNA polymerase sigma factor FliA
MDSSIPPDDSTVLNPEIRRMVTSMLPQARSEAWRLYQAAPHALELDELVSLAYTGLTAAAIRWPAYCAERDFSPGCGQDPCIDPATCGTKFFAAYSLRRLRGSMLDAMRKADWITRSMRTKSKLLRAAEDLRPGQSEAELAAATGLNPRQIRSTMAGVAGRPVSFDAEPHDVADSDDTESQAVVSSVLARVLMVMDGLDPEICVVLALRYHQGLNLAAVAAELRTSEQRVTELHDTGVLAVHDAMIRAVS